MGKFSDKCLEIKGISMVGFVDFFENSHGDSKSVFESKTVGSVENISDFGSSDSGVSIESEYFMEFLKMSW